MAKLTIAEIAAADAETVAAWFKKRHFRATPEIDTAVMVKSIQP
jgi:hypothetical protein